MTGEESLPSGYPEDLEAEVLLADGRAAEVRPILPSDVAALKLLHASLSPESLYMRFFSPRRVLPEAEFERFATVDYVDRLALVLVVDGDSSPSPVTTASVAATRPKWHSRSATTIRDAASPRSCSNTWHRRRSRLASARSLPTRSPRIAACSVSSEGGF